MTDEELIRRHLARERGAFEAILDRFERPLLRLAASLLGDPERAQDAVQEAFVRLLGAGRELAGVQSLSGWLFQVTRNVCYDQIRKEKRMERREAAASRKAARADQGPEGPAMADEVRRLVQGALEGLPARQREAFLHKTWDGLSYREIGERMGLTEANVGYHIHMATRAIAGRLKAAGVLGGANA